jgi:putative RecB family exonuclease
MTVVDSSPKLHYPTNKWAAMNTASLTDAASAHLSIWEQPLKPVTIRALTRVLAGITRDIHEDVFMGGFDWSFDSASRVVYSLKESLKSRPAPFGKDAAEWEKWRKTLIGLTAAKLRIAVPLTDENEFGTPDFDALIVHTTVPERTREAKAQPAAEPVPA